MASRATAAGGFQLLLDKSDTYKSLATLVTMVAMVMQLAALIGAVVMIDRAVNKHRAELDELFARELPINHGLPPGRGPALGRSRADRYFGGGAWYPTTLAAAGSDGECRTAWTTWTQRRATRMIDE